MYLVSFYLNNIFPKSLSITPTDDSVVFIFDLAQYIDLCITIVDLSLTNIKTNGQTICRTLWRQKLYTFQEEEDT